MHEPQVITALIAIRPAGRGIHPGGWHDQAWPVVEKWACRTLELNNEAEVA